MTIEEKLHAATRTPAPRPEFLADLRSDLLQASAAPLPRRPQPRLSLRRPAWVLAFAILLMTLITTLLAIGPQKVLAEVERLLGFVPGTGIVPVGTPLGLAEPYEYTDSGVTLRVESLISTNERTYLTYTIHGLPEKERAYYVSYLELPDGEKYYSRNKISQGFWKPGSDFTNPDDFSYRNTQDFYALPPDTRQVTIVWKRREREDKDPFETWTIPLQVQPIVGELRDRLLPEAYHPADAAATRHDITLRVEEFAPGIDQAAVKLTLQYPDQFSPVGDLMLDLSPENTLLQCESQPGLHPETSVQVEDFRQSIQTITTPGTDGPTYYSQSRTFAFSGLQPGIKRCTLQVAEIGFLIYQQPQKLHVEMGASPHFGDTWPLDADVQVADQQIHIRGARLVEKLSVDGNGRIPVLELLVDPLPADSWVHLNYIYLQESASKSEPYVVDKETGQFLSGMILTPEQLQSGSADFVVDYVEGTLSGPWEITWDQP
jgi:hypothetical protein